MESNTSDTNAKGTDSKDYSNHMLEHKTIPSSPFVARRFDEQWIVTVGRYKVAQGLKTYEDCVKAVETPDWELLTAVIQATMEIHEKITENINQLKLKLDEKEKQS